MKAVFDSFQSFITLKHNGMNNSELQLFYYSYANIYPMMFSTKQLGFSLIHLTCIWKVKNLLSSWEPAILTEEFCCFSEVLQANVG
jgi:hypothetical protein